MPHPLHTVARRHHVATLVAATLALASCNFGYTTRYRRTLDSGDRITIGIESQHVSQHVELRRESRGDIDVYRVVRLEPRTDPADRDGLRWLFRSLRPDIALRFDDGTTVEHPDLAIAAQLRERLDEPDPDLAEALDGMRDLLRLESRERVFAAAAGRAQLPAELEVLVGALAEPGALLAACPDGEAPGGSRSKCLQACVTSLAHHPQLDRLRADRIARLVDRIGHSSRESEALQTLIPTASPEAVTDAALRIGSSKARSTVLQQLAVKQDLSRDEADRIAAAVDGVGSSSREAEVLVALLPKASPEALVHAAVQVGSSRRRFELLHALAQREDLTRGQADRIAAAADEIGHSSYEAELLLALSQQASCEVIVGAARRLGSSTGRSEVLGALAAAPPATTADADRIVRAVQHIRNSSRETEVLLLLVEHASPTVVIDAIGELGSSSGRGQLVRALLATDPLPREAADRLAAAAPNLGSSRDAADWLIALVGRASDEAIAAAAKRLPSNRREQVVAALRAG